MFPTNCTVHGVNTKYHLHRQSANLSCFQKKCILCCHQYVIEFLTFIGPCIIIYFYSTTNKMNLFLKLFSLVKCSTCFSVTAYTNRRKPQKMFGIWTWDLFKMQLGGTCHSIQWFVETLSLWWKLHHIINFIYDTNLNSKQAAVMPALICSYSQMTRNIFSTFRQFSL